MQIQFQLLKKGGSKPDTISLTDVHHAIPDNCQAPTIGDCVVLEYTSPSERLGNHGHFKIISRHFFYDSKGVQQQDIIAIVEEADEIPRNNFRE